MAGELSSGDILEVIVFGAADGQSILNVFHYRMFTPEGGGGGTVVPTIQTAADGVRTIWRNQVLPLLSNSYAVNQYQVSRIKGKVAVPGSVPVRRKLTYDLRAFANGDPVVDRGADVQDPLPTFNAIGVLKRTQLAGRSGRGAIRFAPVSDVSIDGNVVDGAIGGAWQDAADVLFTGDEPFNAGEVLSAAGIVFRKTEYLASAVPNEPPDLFYAEITSTQVRRFASSQTSRKRSSARGA